MTDHDKASPQGPDIDRAIQRHASAYVARGAAISDSITAECIAARDALRTMFTSAAESRQEIRTTGDSLESLSLLADAVWRARETFLDAVGTLNQEGCRQKLAEVLWNDKGGIALALRELVDRRRLDAAPAAKQHTSSDGGVEGHAAGVVPVKPVHAIGSEDELRKRSNGSQAGVESCPSESSPAPTEPMREALEASSTCPICGKDTPHNHYDEDAELELICRPTFEFHLRHWLHMYFPEKRMRRGEMLGVQGWSSRDSYNPQRIIPRRAPADYIDPVIEGLWGQWLAAWLSKPSWCNAFDKIAMAKQIERQSPLAESAALAHPTPTAQTPSFCPQCGGMVTHHDDVPAAKQNISDEMVQAGAKALNPLAFELDEYGDYTAMPAARCDARTEARQAIVAALRAAPNPSPADSELEALKHDIERLTETNSQLLAQVEETTSKLDDMTDLLKQFVYAYEEQDADNFTDSLRSAYAAADAALSSTEGNRG